MTKKQWETLVRNFSRDLVRSVTRNRGDVGKIAALLGLEPGSISDMRKGRSTGSVAVNVRLLFYRAGISDSDAKRILENPDLILKSLETPSALDRLFFELKNHYSENELAAWMRLLISKQEVEKKLKIEVRAKLRKDRTQGKRSLTP